MTKYPARFIWGLILVAFGILMLLDRFDYLDFGMLFNTYWPLLLVGLGLWIVFGRNRTDPVISASVSGVAENIKVTSSNDTLDESTVFGDVSVTVRSGAFRGGEVSAVFGNCSVDLSGATLANGQSRLEVDTVFGAVSILVPSSLPVEVEAGAVMGSLEVNGEKSGGFLRDRKWTSGGYESARNRLFVDASAVMGDVRITSIVR